MDDYGGVIDMRSDTVSKPTKEMRDAMANANVGDDVWGEDPTVTKLEEATAKFWGKDAGLFVPSGTMGNLIAQLVHCDGRLDEIIVGDQAHTFIFEVGGASVVGGIHVRSVPNEPDGTLNLDTVKSIIRGPNVHHPFTKLLILENTHNMMGGRVLPVEYLNKARALCDEYGLKLHCDGARIWNAAASLQLDDVTALSRPFHSLSICFSKGMCAPVGSVLIGTKDFIAKARHMRKMLGGGMRQAGVLAAACLVALDQVYPKLAEDHEIAKKLAEGLQKISNGKYKVLNVVQTNIVNFSVDGPPEYSAKLNDEWEKQGLKINYRGGNRFRAVTHRYINSDALQKTLQIINDVEAKLSSSAAQ